MTHSNGKIVTDIEDIDISGLFHLICRANMVKTDDIMLKEYISLLRSFRNLLVHMTTCRVDEVRELLDFERHYESQR